MLLLHVRTSEGQARANDVTGPVAVAHLVRRRPRGAPPAGARPTDGGEAHKLDRQVALTHWCWLHVCPGKARLPHATLLPQRDLHILSRSLSCGNWAESNMKTLGVLLFLALAAVVTFAYDSHESHESYERYDPFVNSRTANTFMSSQYRTSKMNERIRERNKSPQERQREVCEDYRPCDRYALRHGYTAAYRKYFGQRVVGKKVNQM